jgi:hypothetical protein
MSGIDAIGTEASQERNTAATAGASGSRAASDGPGRGDVPAPVSPWDRAPCRALVRQASARVEWLAGELERLRGQGERGGPGAAERVAADLRRTQHEFTRLASWRTIADFHIARASGLHQVDLFEAFAAHLTALPAQVVTRYVGEAEHEVVIHSARNEHFTLTRALNKAGDRENRREVWNCEHMRDGSFAGTHIMKVLRKGPANGAATLARDPLHYRREFVAQNVAGCFSHPNILALLRFFEVPEAVFCVLPRAERCLFDLVSESHMRLRHGLEEALARDIFRQCYRAVSFLANIGLVHRDVSLENFVFDQVPAQGAAGQVQIVVRLIDFGLTKSLRLQDAESGTWRHEPAAYVGKVYYMAPELFNNAHGDADVDLVACDLWSLGVVLFLLVAGQYPFRMPSHADADYALHYRAGVTKLLRSIIKRGAIDDLRVSEYFLDLLQLALTPAPAGRITLQGMRAHPFLQDA